MIAPFVAARGNRNESPLLREALPQLTRIARVVGLDLRGTIVSLDGVYDCRQNRRCCKNRSLQGVTFTRNGRGAASVNLGRNCVDSRYLAGRCARTNAKVGSLKGSIESGTGRSTTQG
jgi:hypothetical protein